MRIYCILLSALFFYGCNSEKEMTKYYMDNKNDINTFKSLTSELASEYPFNYMSIRTYTDVGIALLVSIEPPFKSMSANYDQKTLQLLTDSIFIGLCDSCTDWERKKYGAMLEDEGLKKLLRIYTKIDPHSISINSEGVFFGLGPPLKHPNKSEVEGGIFMPFGQNFTRELVVKRLDENAFLYDTVVE